MGLPYYGLGQLLGGQIDLLHQGPQVDLWLIVTLCTLALLLLFVCPILQDWIFWQILQDLSVWL